MQGTLTLADHLITTGPTPTASAGAAANCTTGSPTITVTGNDTAGTVTVTTAAGDCVASSLAQVTFAKAFGTAPVITLTPKGASGAGLQYYYDSSTTTFDIKTGTAPTAGTIYVYSYHTLQ